MIKKIVIIILLITGLIVRLYKINSPIADWHSFRQADTSSVTRNFVKNGINILDPRYHDLSNVQSGKDNPQGYRLVEVPLYNATAALIYRLLTLITPISIEVTQRLLAISLSLASALIVYFITFKITRDTESSILSMGSFLFLPYNIYYSRTILPEPTAVFFMLLATLLLLKQKFVSASIPLAIAVLIKPYTALLVFPLSVYMCFYKSYLTQRWSYIKIAFFGILTILPFALWRLWILRHPEGIPVSDWLFNGGNMRFHPAWFRWLFDERLAKLILGSFGLIPLFLGYAYKKNISQKVAILLSLGIIIYFSVIARGNIQHDYYQVLTIPYIAIITGIGLNYIHHFIFSSKIIGFISVIVIATAAIGSSAYVVKEYYKINNPVIIDAGKYVDATLPQNAVIIAPYTGDTAFLYQTNRSGWPTEVYNVNHVRQIVAPRPLYLVSVNFDTYTNMMISKYPTIYRNDKFIILNLNQ